MFGHTDDQQLTDNNFGQTDSTATTYSDNQASSDDTASQNPIASVTVAEPQTQDTSSPFSTPTTPSEPTSTPVVADDGTLDNSVVDDTKPLAGATADHSELLDIKQKALQQLSPLVSHLDQSPEDKFKTTMMMIQASDDHALLPEAYKAAQAITDEKARAQALLDVVNEINYFTQGQ